MAALGWLVSQNVVAPRVVIGPQMARMDSRPRSSCPSPDSACRIKYWLKFDWLGSCTGSPMGPPAMPAASVGFRNPAFTASAPACSPKSPHQGPPPGGPMALMSAVRLAAAEAYRAAAPGGANPPSALSIAAPSCHARMAIKRYMACVSGVVLLANPLPSYG